MIPVKIFISVEGGCITAVGSNTHHLDVTTIDYDVESSDDTGCQLVSQHPNDKEYEKAFVTNEIITELAEFPTFYES